MSFTEKLQKGQLGESLIAKWLNRGGWNVLPAYDIEVQSGKGPRLFTATRGQLITPDMLVFRHKSIVWVEAKTKSAFTWHRLSQTFQTGIDLRHWKSYISVSEVTPFPVWLLFLHKPGNTAKDTPSEKTSPSGLYGQELTRLQKTTDHEHPNWGRSGMVYWQEKSLLKLADYNEITEPSQVMQIPNRCSIFTLGMDHITEQTTLAGF